MIGIEVTQHRRDVVERKIDRAQRLNQAAVSHLFWSEVPIASLRINVCRGEHAGFVVVAQRRDGEAGKHRERTDAEQSFGGHTKRMKSQAA